MTSASRHRIRVHPAVGTAVVVLLALAVAATCYYLSTGAVHVLESFERLPTPIRTLLVGGKLAHVTQH